MGIRKNLKKKIKEKTEKVSKTSAAFVAEVLRTEGVDKVYTIPGVHSLELLDAFSSAGPEPLLVTHEASAVFMADAAARFTGKVGVFFVVPGPGLTNAMTGLATSMLDNIPVVCLVAGLRKNIEKSFMMHEIPQAGMCSPIVKDYLVPENSEELCSLMEKAFRTARQGPAGPVVLELPPEVMESPYPSGRYNARQAQSVPDVLTSAEALRAVEMLLQNDRTMIYAGRGAFAASRQLMEMAELLGAPVATSISGRGIIPEDHELSLGYGWGPAGTMAAQTVFESADLVFAIGVRFSEMATAGFGMPEPAKMIHLDVDQNALHANMKAELALRADSGSALDQILRQLRKRLKNPRDGLRPQMRDKRGTSGYAAPVRRGSQVPDPSSVYRVLRKLMPRDGILVADTGNHMLFSLEDYSVFSPDTYFAPVDYQSMGYAVPAAVALSMIDHGRKVVAAVGDGCFLMSGIELLTAARHGADVVVLLFADRSLGIIRETQSKIYASECCVDLEPPDYAHLARSLKARHMSVKKAGEIEPVLKQALSTRGPVLVVVDTHYDRQSRYAQATMKAASRGVDLSSKLRMGARLAGRFIGR